MNRAGSAAPVALVMACALGGCTATRSLEAGKTGSLALERAPEVDGDVTTATVNGIQVIVKRIPGAELVTGSLFLEGGVRNWGKDDAGVEELACAVAASGGTEKMPKDLFARRLAALGSTIRSSTSEDYAVLSGKSLLENWDETFALLADAFLHPALPPSEIELHRARLLTTLRHELENPDAHLRLLSRQMLWKGHPYENRAIGTLETVARLDRPALVAHLAKLREARRLLFVAVGDVDAGHIIGQVRAALGALPAGSYVDAPIPPVSFAQPTLQVVEKKLPTNYILGRFVAPTWQDPDFAVALVSMELLSWREFEEVRTKRNLSYAPDAGLEQNSRVPLGRLYVTAVDANATVEVLFGEARRLQSEPPPPRELEGNKSTFLTGYLMDAETTTGQAAMLARAQLLGGDWRLARALPQRIRAVTPAQVQAFARKYIGRLQTVVLGDPSRLDRRAFTSL